MFLLLGSAGWTFEVQTGLIESCFLSLGGTGVGGKFQAWLQQHNWCQGSLWHQRAADAAKAYILRIFQYFKIENFQSEGPQIPCLYPSLLVPLPRHSSCRQTEQDLLFSSRSAQCSGVCTAGPSSWQGRGKCLHPLVPWCSVSWYLPLQPPWLHAPPMLIWSQESLASDPWVISWHRIFISFNISINIYSCSTSNCDWLRRIWKTKEFYMGPGRFHLQCCCDPAP